MKITNAKKIEMLIKALTPFADLLEYPQESPEVIELEITSSDVQAAKDAINSVRGS